MQLGHRIRPVAKDVTPARQVGRRLARRRRQHSREQAPGVLGDVREGETTFPLRSQPSAARQEATELPVSCAVHRPEQDGAGIHHRDLGPDDQLEADLPGGDVGTNDSGHAVPVGDGQPGVTQPPA